MPILVSLKTDASDTDCSDVTIAYTSCNFEQVNKSR